MSRSDPMPLADYLGQILEATQRIEIYTEGTGKAAFLVGAKT